MWRGLWNTPRACSHSAYSPLVGWMLNLNCLFRLLAEVVALCAWPPAYRAVRVFAGKLSGFTRVSSSVLKGRELIVPFMKHRCEKFIFVLMLSCIINGNKSVVNTGTDTPRESYRLPHPTVHEAAGERIPVHHSCHQTGIILDTFTLHLPHLSSLLSGSP